EWREKLTPLDPWNRRVLMATLAVFGVPPTYLDLGSGTGAMVDFARRIGVDAMGVDMIARSPPDTRADLSKPLDLGRQYDLVTCIEVAEHIRERDVGVFCNNVSGHVRANGYLVFTAAGPGQAGDGHVHLKPAPYWRTMFHERDLNWQERRTLQVKLAWQMIPMPMMWLASNVQVFHRRPVVDEPEEETER
ncbi:MAG: methyltransferase domain-containing protein, partial [Gemmatimonadales bacterium]|nr:methyltransferase domain-containing protein [Gemmatimonadales bacterium]